LIAHSLAEADTPTSSTERVQIGIQPQMCRTSIQVSDGFGHEARIEVNRRI
jgi:hypothetical protein